MSEVEFQSIINGFDIWVAVFFMTAIVVVQSIVFLRAALKQSVVIGIDKQKRRAAIRAASITAIGPSLSPVIIMFSMIMILGAPNTWFVLNNVGAARTELAAATLGAGLAGVTVMDTNIGLTAWNYALWAGALNSAGWLIVVFFLNHRMADIVTGLYSKYDEKWIKLLLAGATLGLFAYLLSNQLVNKSTANYFAAGSAGLILFVLTTIFGKHQRLQELSLGIAMLSGMFLTEFFY